MFRNSAKFYNYFTEFKEGFYDDELSKLNDLNQRKYFVRYFQM